MNRIVNVNISLNDLAMYSNCLIYKTLVNNLSLESNQTKIEKKVKLQTL